MLQCSPNLSKIFTNFTSAEYNSELIRDNIMILEIAIISLHSINNDFYNRDAVFTAQYDLILEM
jgi:hypothetical protein